MDPNDDVNMDIDLELDLGDDIIVPEEVQEEAMRIDQDVQLHPAAPGPVQMNDHSIAELVLEKVYIRFTEHSDLHDADVRAYAAEHYPNQFQKVQWINDQSCNLIYETAEAAAEALNAFTDITQIIDFSSLPVHQERLAKRLSARPEIEFITRQSTSGDVKARGARDASRYYLLHPEEDPRERRKHNDKRGRGRDREDNRRRYGDRSRRGDDDDSVPFDVNMYDDDAGGDTRKPSARAPRRGSWSSYSSSEDRSRRRGRFNDRHDGGDLFPEKVKNSGRLRDRSASPRRDGDGTQGFEEDEGAMQRQRARFRDRSPASPKPRHNSDTPRNGNAGKELFATTNTSTPSTNVGKELFAKPTNVSALQQPVELFPEKAATPKPRKEGFPNRTPHSNHRRTDAFDAADESDIRSPARDLASRISGGPTPQRDESRGYSIRGSASAMEQEQAGFNIRGASKEGNGVKELFPLKTGGNVGKELFSEKIKGRGGPRRKAEDMFF